MMSKKKEQPLVFTTTLMVANQPTVPNGEIYTLDILQSIVERIKEKPYIIIQEMNPVEREAKKIPLALPWSKKVMATVTSGEVVDGKLVLTCVTRLNRDGRKLAGILESIGMENIDFFPVGYGVTGDDGLIKPNYQLNYIAVEPKKL